MKMTLAQFIATGHDSNNIGEAIGDETLEQTKGRIYVDVLFIELLVDGRYFLTLGNSQYISDLSELEAKLYEWADGEGYLGEETNFSI